MNREIKFRGRNDRHGWLTGHYFVNRGVHFIVEDGIADPFNTWEDYAVDPDTVGQYTGLKDWNGIEIYEGDIINFKNFRRARATVSWEEVFCEFELYFGPRTSWRMYKARKLGCKVIGNIHDNPELLEGGK